VITIDLYKGDVASFRCYSIFFDPVWCSSFVVALEMESAIFFLHLSLLSNLVLVVGLKNQLSPSLNYRFFYSWSLGSACFSLLIVLLIIRPLRDTQQDLGGLDYFRVKFN